MSALPPIIISGYFHYHYLQEAIPATGTVVEFSEKRDKDNKLMYVMQISFEDQYGNRQLWPLGGRKWSIAPVSAIGTTKEILYRQDDEYVTSNTFFSRWFGVVISLGILIYVLIIAVAVEILHKTGCVKRWYERRRAMVNRHEDEVMKR